MLVGNIAAYNSISWINRIVLSTLPIPAISLSQEKNSIFSIPVFFAISFSNFVILIL